MVGFAKSGVIKIFRSVIGWVKIKKSTRRIILSDTAFKIPVFYDNRLEPVVRLPDDRVKGGNVAGLRGIGAELAPVAVTDNAEKVGGLLYIRTSAVFHPLPQSMKLLPAVNREIVEDGNHFFRVVAYTTKKVVKAGVVIIVELPRFFLLMKKHPPAPPNTSMYLL